MNVLAALLLSITLQTPVEIVTHPNGLHETAIQCVQCGDWYLPQTINELTCPCDYDV